MNKLARSSYHEGSAFHRETSPESQENMNNQLALLQGREGQVKKPWHIITSSSGWKCHVE
jgi:hypothetical protein